MSGTAEPTWSRSPPAAPASPNLERWGRWGFRLFGRGGPVLRAATAIFDASPTAPPWRDETPRDAFEQQLFRKATDLAKQGVPQADVQEWFKNERSARARRKPDNQEDPRPKPVPPPPGTVRITQKRRKCLVDEYKKLLSVCDGDSHHIVPDMVYRLGSRPKGAGMNSTANRIPNGPTLNEGMAVCLTKNQHGEGRDGIHADLKASLDDLGDRYTPNGTAPLGAILEVSKRSIDKISDLPEDCKKLAKSKLGTQVQQKNRDPEQPGRTRENSLPSGDAKTVL